MLIATFNVNSIRARLSALLEWLERRQPDVVLLQETKVVDQDFPSEEFTRRGYGTAFSGQKTYNGVAILSRFPMREVALGLFDEPDPTEKRIIRATIEGLRIVCAYVPNGKDVTLPAFPQKLSWLTRFGTTLRNEMERAPLVVGGDFNIAHTPLDLFNPEQRDGQIHFHPSEREALNRLLALGLLDAFRELHPTERAYSWWDYRGGSVRQNHGMRLDYLLVDRRLRDRLDNASIDRDLRSGTRPSDHVPVLIELK